MRRTARFTATAAVALFTRAWIEITHNSGQNTVKSVALFTRAWIEMLVMALSEMCRIGRPLHEGVD